MKFLRRLFFCSCCLLVFGCDFPFFIEDEKYGYSAELIVHNNVIKWSSEDNVTFHLQKEFIFWRDDEEVISETKVVSKRDSCLFFYKWDSHVSYDNYNYVYLCWTDDNRHWKAKKFWVKSGEIFQIVLNEGDDLVVSPTVYRK